MSSIEAILNDPAYKDDFEKLAAAFGGCFAISDEALWIVTKPTPCKRKQEDGDDNDSTTKRTRDE